MARKKKEGSKQVEENVGGKHLNDIMKEHEEAAKRMWSNLVHKDVVWSYLESDFNTLMRHLSHVMKDSSDDELNKEEARLRILFQTFAVVIGDGFGSKSFLYTIFGGFPTGVKLGRKRARDTDTILIQQAFGSFRSIMKFFQSLRHVTLPIGVDSDEESFGETIFWNYMEGYNGLAKIEHDLITKCIRSGNYFDTTKR